MPIEGTSPRPENITNQDTNISSSSSKKSSPKTSSSMTNIFDSLTDKSEKNLKKDHSFTVNPRLKTNEFIKTLSAAEKKFA